MLHTLSKLALHRIGTLWGWPADVGRCEDVAEAGGEYERTHALGELNGSGSAGGHFV